MPTTGIKRAGPSVLNKLRTTYSNIWGREWPYDDEYLSELWFEQKLDLGVSKNTKTHPLMNVVYEETLMRMRENHEFTKA